jgi:hypothetical protein
MRPPKCSTIWRLMGRPRPGALRPVDWRRRPGGTSRTPALLRRRHAGAVVLHLDRARPARAPQPHLDAPALARHELGRVGQQVQHHLQQPVGVGAQRGHLVPGSAGSRRRRARGTARPWSAPPAPAAAPRSTSALSQSAWPDSILAMSSTWLTRRLRRSARPPPCPGTAGAARRPSRGRRASARPARGCWSAACAARASRCS